MPGIKCTAPACEVTFDSTFPSEVLIRLIDIHTNTAHPPLQVTTTEPTKAEKVKRAMVSAAGSSEEFTYFEQRWEDYKAACHLQGADIVFQLLECCDESLRKDLTRAFGSLSSSDEATVLQKIQTLAVRQENVMVARVQLQDMKQDRDEPVRAFAARLKGQASVCQYTVKCTSCDTKVSYSNNKIHDSLIHGVYDEDIRLDVLGQPRLAEQTLEETISLIEAKESGKRSAGRLLLNNNGPAMSTATASSYRRQERNRLQSKGSRAATGKQTVPSGGYCGQYHPRPSSRKERMRLCAAYNHTCSNCGIPHHFEKVCRSNRQKHSTPPSDNTTTWSSDDTTAVFEALCRINSIPHHHRDINIHCVDTTSQCSSDSASGTLDPLCTIDAPPPLIISHDSVSETHTLILEQHIYNDLCKTWERRSSEQKAIRVLLSKNYNIMAVMISFRKH